MTSGIERKPIVTNPPKNIPSTKIRFHISFFHSYLKKGMFAGKHMAQACRSDELIPNDLFPKSNNAGTVKPTRGPATYHGQGCWIKSTIFISVSLSCKFAPNYCGVVLQKSHKRKIVSGSSNKLYR